jgi:DNA modification methylase
MNVNVSELKEYKFSKEMFEDLKLSDYSALKNDIVTHGIKVALHILPDKTVICGHQRLRVAKELGLKTVPCEIEDLKNDAEIQEWAIKDNLLRRQLTTEQRYLLYAKLSEIYEIGRGKPLKEWSRDKTGHVVKPEDATVASSGDVLERTAKETGESPRTIASARAYQHAIKDDPELKKKSSVTWVIKEHRRREERKERERAVINIELKNLVCGDALAEIKKLKKESIDCVIIDPPYGIEYHPMRYEKVLDDNKEIFPYMRKVGAELFRIMKKDSHLYCFCGWKDSYCLTYSALETAGFDIDGLIVWVKNQRGVQVDFSKKYAHFHEFIIYATKGERHLNNSMSRDVLEFDKVKDGYVATQKPVPLLKYLVENSTVKGEVVLDCFAGSGSALVAAEELGRNWIGIEKDKQLCDVAKARILEIKREENLDNPHS